MLNSEAEKYINKDRLRVLLDKIRNVMKEDNVHPNLIILILFSIRILILRLRKETLNGIFKIMWPSILFLLEKMIRSKKWEKKCMENEIIVAALKLLEIITCSDIDEFNLHKWAFVFEYYEVSITLAPVGTQIEQKSPFDVNPMLFDRLPREAVVSYITPKFESIDAGSRRTLVIKENRMNNDVLTKRVQQFLTYYVVLSSKNIELDAEELESLIQGDFIDFGNFINL